MYIINYNIIHRRINSFPIFTVEGVTLSPVRFRPNFSTAFFLNPISICYKDPADFLFYLNNDIN